MLEFYAHVCFYDDVMVSYEIFKLLTFFKYYTYTFLLYFIN